MFLILSEHDFPLFFFPFFFSLLKFCIQLLYLFVYLTILCITIDFLAFICFMISLTLVYVCAWYMNACKCACMFKGIMYTCIPSWHWYISCLIWKIIVQTNNVEGFSIYLHPHLSLLEVRTTPKKLIILEKMKIVNMTKGGVMYSPTLIWYVM